MSEEPTGKRVSWVELYFDLIFVFAVGQMTHIMTTEPRWSGFGVALGLFTPLWGTWVGFVILYNRHGEDRTAQRLLVLAGTLPCAVAAIEAHAAAGGHGMAFAFALAGARLVLAAGLSVTTGPARRVAIGYAFSTAGFVVSAFVPSPWRYVLWAFLLIQEAGLLLLRYGERDSGGRARERGGEHEGQRERPARPSRTESVLAMFKPPADPASRVDAAHLSERFGLMMMILLGEVVVAVAGSAAGVPVHGWQYWLGLLAGLVFVAALWWIYFTAAAWFITGGLAAYLLATRAVATDPSVRFGELARMAVVAVTVGLAFLEPLITATGVLLVITAWAAAIAAYVTWRFPGRLKDVAADPLSYFHPAPDRPQRQPS